MIVQRSRHILGQLASKSSILSRNTTAPIRQNHQRLNCQQYQQYESQMMQQLQQQRQQQQQKRNYHIQPLLLAAIKSNLNKNPCKGSVCLVLLPVSTVSCAATLSVSTTPTASIATSSGSFKSESDESNDMSSKDYKNAKSVYDFTVTDTHGNEVSLEKYKGQVLLIVNIASQCGLTKNNYQKLTDLKAKYHDQGLRILNFPCNQFGSQMPEQDGEAMVCHLRDSKADIGDVFKKIDVNGADTAPLYQYLKAKQTGTLGSAIKWNFTKFLVNKEGIPVNRYAPTTDPMDIAKDIEKLL